MVAKVLLNILTITAATIEGAMDEIISGQTIKDQSFQAPEHKASTVTLQKFSNYT